MEEFVGSAAEVGADGDAGEGGKDLVDANEAGRAIEEGESDGSVGEEGVEEGQGVAQAGALLLNGGDHAVEGGDEIAEVVFDGNGQGKGGA